ncbi:hypothetical protein [Mesorhizobium sp. J8]|uniref:hypothetical protein n=1 Tax=Mesorhizobium sp. J8 TaxID=2777475 RepID=UPI001CD8635B|nr:hypothetical protein [Mesorhizobium sp. J8]
MLPQSPHHAEELAPSLERRTPHLGTAEGDDLGGNAVTRQEAGEMRLAEKHDSDAGILKLQVLGQRRGKDDVADELGLHDQNRSESGGGNLQHGFWHQ